MYLYLSTVVILAATAFAQLNQLAKQAGLLYFGTAVDRLGHDNQRYMAIALDVNEFGQVTPANGQMWDVTEPTPGKFDFTSGDAIVNPARQAGQIIRCHTLVYYIQLPPWGEFFFFLPSPGIPYTPSNC
jgi:endo-1,4-beta-xylanase